MVDIFICGWMIHDWHPDGVLLDKYGLRIIYDAHSSLNARLSIVLRNGSWVWKLVRSDALVEIQNKLP